MSDADLLRRAADLLDRLSAAITPGPWHLDAVYTIEQGCRCLSCWETWAWGVREVDGPEGPDQCSAAIHVGHGDAEWMATLGPQVAAPLAAWLRTEADCHDTIAAARQHVPELVAAIEENATGKPAPRRELQVAISTVDAAVQVARVILREVAA